MTGPLSYGQRSLWFLHQLAPGESAYNVTLAARLVAANSNHEGAVGAALRGRPLIGRSPMVTTNRSPIIQDVSRASLVGEIDIAALRASLQCLVDRHSSLRTVFTARRGKPVQEIRELQEVSFLHVDTSDLSQDEAIAKLVEASHKPFDLERGPLLRAGIYARADNIVLLLTLHHIIVDFASLLTILEELGALYSAQRAGCCPALPHRSTQYVDYCRWQSEILDGDQGEKLWGYWQNQLRGAPQAITLPFDRPRSQVQTFKGTSTRIDLGEELTGALRRTLAAEGGSLYTLLLAAFQALLCGWASQDEVVVGSPPIGKRQAKFDGVVGFFHNPIPLRGSISGNPTFSGFHATVQQTVAEALDHREYPFSLLVERLRASRDVSHSPIFQVMFVLYEAGGPSWLESLAGGARGRARIGALELEFLDIEEKVSMLDLTLTVFEDENSMSAVLQYNTDLFDPGTAGCILEDFRSLLSAVCDDPARPVSELLAMECSRPARRAEPLECGATQLAATRLAALSPLFSRVSGLPPERASLGSGQPIASQHLDFSLFYRGNSDGSSPRDGYRLLIDSARDAERMGFRAVWLAEQVGPGRGVFPSPAVLAAGLAARTDRVQIRAVTVVTPLHSPLHSPLHNMVRAAEEWSVVDNLSNGRAGICFAPDLSGSESAPDPENGKALEALVAEKVETLRRLWRGQTVAFDGPFGKPVAVQTLPRPIQADLPVWLFASESSPEMFRLAGEIGAGILIEPIGSVLTRALSQISDLQFPISDLGATQALGHHQPITAGIDSLAESIKLYRRVWRDHGHGPGRGHAVLILPTSDLEGTPEFRLSVIERLGSIDIDEVACLLDLVVSGSNSEGRVGAALRGRPSVGRSSLVMDQLSALEALREAANKREGDQESEREAFDRLASASAPPVEQIESIPAEEIRNRAQTRRAMLKRNTGIRTLTKKET